MDFYIGTPHSTWGIDRLSYFGDPEKRTDTPLCILESFYYVEAWMFRYIDNKVWDFMLDSGAFTFLEQKAAGVDALVSGADVDWDQYVRRYADFIVEHDVLLFFELDIDSLVGYKRVCKLRDALEKLVGRRCIPVWHKSRGLDEWKSMVRSHDYVAIGGIARNEIKRSEHKIFTPLCDLAHAQGTRVHGLGLTPVGGNGVGTMYRFDSVDSTSWTFGNRAGFVSVFDGRTMKKFEAPQGFKIKARDAGIHNFREWVKYQRYMKHAGWRMET